MIIILMGVAGSGKTTIGSLLAARLGWEFIEGDDFHPQANIIKMSSGTALHDADRLAWLTALRAEAETRLNRKKNCLIACSALKKQYRDLLETTKGEIIFVFLKGEMELVRKRLKTRTSHFFDAELLTSQFEILEEPDRVLTIDISPSPDHIAREIIDELQLQESNEGPDGDH